MPDLLKGLLIALAASGLTLGGHQWLATPSTPGPAPLQRGRDTGVDEALARIEALLRKQDLELAGGISGPPAPTPTRQSASGPASSTSELEEVLARLSAIEGKLHPRPKVVRELQPLDRQHAPNLPAIRAAMKLREADRQASEQDLGLRTMQEMVERFGFPDRAAASGSDQSDMYWRYELPSTDPQKPNYFSIYYLGGRVMWTQGRWVD